MLQKQPGINDIPTQIKNSELVTKRRRQIADAAIKLFIKYGFHKTTTRQIAKAAGVSIGSLYEYIASKEDILYLVCDSIHTEVERVVTDAMPKVRHGRQALKEVIERYFLVCHKMSDFILLIYRETKSLPPQWQKRVLENELRITGLFVEIMAKIAETGELPRLNEHSIDLAAHNITVLGHMWTFRRWYLGRHYTLEKYIALQTEFVLGLYE